MNENETPIYAAVLTDPSGRRVNEDAVYTCQTIEADKIAARGYLYIVADGTGAQEGGQTASSMAVAIISEYFYDDTSPDIGESLRTAIAAAHTALYELAQRVSSWAEISTTVVAAVVHRGELYVAHVGDSRAYLIREGQSRLLTRDHVWLQDDENYGALIRWLGGGSRPSVEVDLTVNTLQENDIVVLCSDGLTDVVDGTDIGSLVGKDVPQSTVRQLIELANRRGTGDNVSVAVIQYGGKTLSPPRRGRTGLAAGVIVLLGMALILALILTQRSTTNGGGGGSSGTIALPTATLLPAHIQVKETATPTPTTAAPSVQETRMPTSTPVPATDTPTPRPTRRAVPTIAPTSVAATAIPSPVPTSPPPPPPPPPTSAPHR